MFLEKLIITFIGILSATIAFATVNINTASVEQLQQVRHIGPVKAKKIVEYRKEHGNFKSINELTQVKGIGDKLLAKVKNELSVSGATTNTSTKLNNQKSNNTKAKKVEDKAQEPQVAQDKTNTKDSSKNKKNKKSHKKNKK